MATRKAPYLRAALLYSALSVEIGVGFPSTATGSDVLVCARDAGAGVPWTMVGRAC